MVVAILYIEKYFSFSHPYSLN